MPTKHRLDRSTPVRPGAARTRLTHALATLTERTPMPSRVTVAELCRLAKVSRNSLYRYHAPILAAVRRHQGPKSARTRALRSAERHRSENAILRDRVVKLVALVDHYFAGYRETEALLKRRDRELSELRSRLDSQPALLARPRGPDATAVQVCTACATPEACWTRYGRVDRQQEVDHRNVGAAM